MEVAGHDKKLLFVLLSDDNLSVYFAVTEEKILLRQNLSETGENSTESRKCECKQMKLFNLWQKSATFRLKNYLFQEFQSAELQETFFTNALK